MHENEDENSLEKPESAFIPGEMEGNYSSIIFNDIFFKTNFLKHIFAIIADKICMNDHECVTETATEFLNQVSCAKNLYILIYVLYYI